MIYCLDLNHVYGLADGWRCKPNTVCFVCRVLCSIPKMLKYWLIQGLPRIVNPIESMTHKVTADSDKKELMLQKWNSIQFYCLLFFVKILACQKLLKLRGHMYLYAHNNGKATILRVKSAAFCIHWLLGVHWHLSGSDPGALLDPAGAQLSHLQGHQVSHHHQWQQHHQILHRLSKNDNITHML